MNITQHLLAENSRKNWDAVVTYVGADATRFDELMRIFFEENTRLMQRASQPITMIAERHPELIMPYLPEMVKKLQSNPIDAVKRITMRTLQFVTIPEEIEGEIFEFGMGYLKSLEEPIAVKAFSMTVLRKICERYPELATEVIFQIEILVKEKVSTGIVNRGNRELKKLRTLLG